jgi:hypothetical protein
MSYKLIHVTLSNGDTATFLNDTTIITRESWEREGALPEDVATQLSRALNVEVVRFDIETPKEDDWNWLDVLEALPEVEDIKVKPFETKEITRFKLLHDGNNSAGYSAEASRTGDAGIYEEVRISIFHEDDCVADVLAGLSSDGEPRILVTHGGDGDGDHRIAVYPLREISKAVDVDFE